MRPVSRIRRPRKRIKSGPSPCHRPPSSADLRLLCGAEKPPRTRLRPARAALGCEVSRGRRAFRNCRPGTRSHHSRSRPRSPGGAVGSRLRECHGAVAGAARAWLPRGTATGPRWLSPRRTMRSKCGPRRGPEAQVVPHHLRWVMAHPRRPRRSNWLGFSRVRGTSSSRKRVRPAIVSIRIQKLPPVLRWSAGSPTSCVAAAWAAGCRAGHRSPHHGAALAKLCQRRRKLGAYVGNARALTQAAKEGHPGQRHPRPSPGTG